MFFSVVTKNLNWEILTKNLVSFVTSASRRLDKKEDLAVPGINDIYACKKGVKHTTMPSKWVLIQINTDYP